MKRKVILFLLTVTLLIGVLAVSASAAGATSDAYDDITVITGESEPATINKNARVVIVASDGTYYTFPAYYIVADNAKFTWKKNEALNSLLGYSLSNASDIRTKIVRMEIPEGITSINPNDDGGATVFEDAKLMVEVKIPSTITKIGAHAFNRCYKLATIDGLLEYLAKDTTTTLGNQMIAETLWGEGVDLVIPKNVTSVPERCFYGTKIKSVTFHDNITVLGARAFQSCPNITSVKLPANLCEMQNHVFASCSSLKAIDTSACKSLAKIGNYCFEYDPLTTFDFTPFASNLTSLGDGLFNKCQSLESVPGYELADGVSSIGANMFYYCPLTELKFPKNITSIGNYAFFYHKSAQNVIKIPNGVTTIGNHAFVRDKNVAKVSGTVEIHLPASLTGFTGDYNFEYWDFDIMYIPANVTFTQGVFNGTLDKGVVYYYTGDKDTLTIHGTHNAAILNAEWVHIDNFTGASSDKNYVVYGYNECDAFYDSIHLDDDYNCLTRCNDCARKLCSVAIEAKIEHASVHTVVYKNGFLEAGVHTQYCTNGNCTAGDKTEQLLPMFVAEGYSYKIAGTTAGISVRYKINTYEFGLYQDHVSKLSFGIIVANADKIGPEVFINDDGVLNAIENKGVQVELKSDNYSYLTCTVDGFTNSEAHLGLKLVMSAYVFEVDKDGNKTSDITYIQKQYIKNEDEIDPAYTAYASTIERDATLGVVTISQVKAHDEYLMK